jgi:signal transduction histidine kinase
VVAVLLMCAVAAGAVAIIMRRVAGPVADIVGAADRIARRDYRVRVEEPARGPRWVADTARAFNAMAKELETQDAARRNLMADIAHELRTPAGGGAGAARRRNRRCLSRRYRAASGCAR